MAFNPEKPPYIPIDERQTHYRRRKPGLPPLQSGKRSKAQDQIHTPDDVPVELTIPEDAPPDEFLAVPIFRKGAPLIFYKGIEIVGQFTELPVPLKEIPSSESKDKTLKRNLSTRISRARLTLCLMYFYKVFLWCRIYYHSDGTPRQYGKDWRIHFSRRFMIRPVRVLSGLVEIYRMVNTNTTPITRDTLYKDGVIDPNNNSIETLCQLVMKRTSMDTGRNNACLGDINANWMAKIIIKILDMKHQFGDNEEEDMLEIKRILEVTVKNLVQRKKPVSQTSNLLKQRLAGQSPSPGQDRFMEGYYSEPSFPLRKIIQEFTISWNIGTKYQDVDPDIKKYLMGTAKYSATMKKQLQQRMPYDFYSEPGVEGDDAILQKSIVQGKDIDPPLDRNSILTIDQPTTDTENTPEFQQKLTNILMNLFQLYGQYCFINLHITPTADGNHFDEIKESIPYEFYESELTRKVGEALRSHMANLDLLTPTEDVDKEARRTNALRVRSQNAALMADLDLFVALPADVIYQTKDDGVNKMGQYDMNDPEDFYCFFCEIIIPFLYLKIWEIRRQILDTIDATTQRQQSKQIQQKIQQAIRSERRKEIEPRWKDIDKLSIDQSEKERIRRIYRNKVNAMNISLEAAKFAASNKASKMNRIKQMAMTWYFLLSQFQLEYLNSVHTQPPYQDADHYEADITFQNPLFREFDPDNVQDMLSLSTHQLEEFIRQDSFQKLDFSFFEGKNIYHGFTYLKNPSGLPPPPPEYLLSNSDQTSYFDDMVRYMIRRARHLSPKNQRFMLKYCCQYDSKLLNFLLPKQLVDIDYFNRFYKSDDESDEVRKDLIQGIIGVENSVSTMNFIRELWSRK
jgi:hypothetical protein